MNQDNQTPFKVALITGGTSGLGLACARALLNSDLAPRWEVVIASRDPLAGAKTVTELNEFSGREAARFMQLDLGDLENVKSFASSIKSEGLRFDAFAFNAGLQFTKPARTKSGLEATFAINHLGHFALFQHIGDLLNPNGRVAVVSSGTHDPAMKTGLPAPRWVDPTYLAYPERDSSKSFEGRDSETEIGRRRYTTSKLCNLYFAYELDRRIRSGSTRVAPGVTVTAFDPGMMPGTGLARTYPAPIKWVWENVMPAAVPLLRMFMQRGNVKTPEQSGAALARLLHDVDIPHESGSYFEGLRKIPSSNESYDKTRAEKLWSVSETLILHRDGDSQASIARSEEGTPTRIATFASFIAVCAVVAIVIATPHKAISQTTSTSPVGLWKTFGDDGKIPRGMVRVIERNGELIGTLAGSLVPGVMSVEV